jgi:DNA processing protein
MAGLHPDRRSALVARLGSPGRVLRGIEAGRVEVSRRAEVAVHRSAAESEAILAQLGVVPVLLGDPGYPPALTDLPDAPDLLFVRGDIPLEGAVAVVGTRTCTGYGRELAAAYGRAIAGAGWVVVSGLARGIDGAAHRGMLEAGGRGIAVLGSGSNVVYPAENRDVHDLILSGGGAIVTEYPPGTPPEAWRFPPRNRIIAGLAAATVVVEAAATGGALITAGAALEQGRQVMAVPGDVDRESSRGCNLLIRDGALPVLEPADLIESLSLVLGPPASPSRPMPPGDGSAFEAAILASLGASDRSLEDLAGLVVGPTEEVLAAVTRLEEAGRVIRRGALVCATGLPKESSAGPGGR